MAVTSALVLVSCCSMSAPTCSVSATSAGVVATAVITPHWSSRERNRFIKLSRLRAIRRFDPLNRFLVGFDHAVAGGIRIDQAPIDMNLLTIDSPCFDALPDGANKKGFK
jgi:hypothetical protein